MKTGTGLTRYHYDYNKKNIEIDFTGNGGDQNYRNDASIFLFAANSYRESFFLIGKEIDNRFSNNSNIRQIGHLILPFYFNYRHFVELELKGIYCAITGKSPRMTHKLQILISDVESAIEDFTNSDEIVRNNATAEKVEAASILEGLKETISRYSAHEAVDEYYRYLFEKGDSELELNHPIVSLDYQVIWEDFMSSVRAFDKLCASLNEMGAYVYNFL